MRSHLPPRPLKIASNTLIAAGLCMIAVVVVAYARTSVRQAELKARWEERPTLPAPALAAENSGEKGTPGGRPASPRGDSSVVFAEGDPVARLLIPRIGLDAMVLEGIADETLDVAPGHYPGMAFPGDGGHAVLAAHRDSFFKEFGRLEPGDRISVTRWDGRQVEYGISRIYIVHKTDRTVIVPKGEELLTLITCYPFDYVGPAPYRYIVEAVPSTAAEAAVPAPGTVPAS